MEIQEDEKFAFTGLKQEMTNELLDYIETDYFQGALYESIQDSFKDHIVGDIQEELMEKPELFISNKAELTGALHVIKLTTLLYRMQNQGLVIDSLK